MMKRILIAVMMLFSLVILAEKTSAATPPNTIYWTTTVQTSASPAPYIFYSRAMNDQGYNALYRGYLTLKTTGYAPGNWRVYAGTLYKQGIPYPSPFKQPIDKEDIGLTEF